MPAKKEENISEKKNTQAKSVKKEESKKEKGTLEKKTSPTPKTPKKSSDEVSKTTSSKGKQKKIRIEEKFSGRQYTLGVGKRKSATALVRLYEKGKGELFVNNQPFSQYFFDILIEKASSPMDIIEQEASFDITVKVMGGGINAQSEAVRHGIARALVLHNSEWRPLLKKAGLLTRDARVKERKKPGLKRARRAPQWKKR